MSAPVIAVVTGGAGFIGSHMVDLLVARGIKVRVIDDFSGGRRENLASHRGNSAVEVFEQDVRSLVPGNECFADATYVFHFAGIGDIVPSIERPADYMSVNVQGTVSVLECARLAGIRKFVYAASSSCYGLAAVPTAEGHAILPRYPYALSKYQGEQAAFHWHSLYGLPVNSLRIFNAYGPRARTSGAYGGVLGVFLRQKIEGVPFTVVGDGAQCRDFVYVTDVAKAFLAAAESPNVGRVYNLGAGNPQSVNRLVELLHGGVEYIPRRPGEPDVTWADIRLIGAELGWRPETSFEEGIARIVSDIDYWRDAPLWGRESIANATRTWFEFMQS